MPSDDSLLEAIKDSSSRQERSTEKMLGAIADVGNDVRNLAAGIAKGFAQQQPKPGNGSNGPVITMLTVILGLAGVFTAVASHNSTVSEIRAEHQRELTEIYSQQSVTGLLDLDDKLQKELAGVDRVLTEKFDIAERDSTERHNEQEFQIRSLDRKTQRAIGEVKTWFGPPPLRSTRGE